MDKQLIIAIGRECGSGGRIIAEIVGEKLGIDVLDKNMLDEVSEASHIDIKHLEKYDEKAKAVGRILGVSMGNEVTRAIWNHISSKAARGESFVVVGRCAEEVLKANPNLLSVFICADQYDKYARMVDEYGFSEGEAEDIRRNTDENRKKFHDRNSDTKWGDNTSYDFVVNSSNLGINGTAEAIVRMAAVKMESRDVKASNVDEVRRKEQYLKRVQESH